MLISTVWIQCAIASLPIVLNIWAMGTALIVEDSHLKRESTIKAVHIAKRNFITATSAAVVFFGANAALR